MLIFFIHLKKRLETNLYYAKKCPKKAVLCQIDTKNAFFGIFQRELFLLEIKFEPASLQTQIHLYVETKV